MELKNKIAIVIVLYNPSKLDIENVKRLAAYNRGIVVDNSLTPSIDGTSIGNLQYICNKKNLGIAEAQNIALRQILQEDYEYIVFIDQDSRISTDYAKRIQYEFTRNVNKNLAIIGPTVIHKENKDEYKSIIHNYDYDCLGFSQRRHIISSGSCISTQALREIGLFDGSLFIDYVDFEWCWRAYAKGYKCGITNKIEIEHKVGQRELSLGKYKIILSSPERYFYQCRNYFWLIRKKYVPLQWKIATGIKLILRFIYFPILVKGGWTCWKYMAKGIKKGIWQKK